jgi:serine/threonine protein kinase
MIFGWPPFYHEQPMKVYEKIILGKIDYPSTFSKALEDIISKLLVNNPSKRLGNMKGGIADIIKHKWFGSFDWRGLLAGTLMAPYMPDLTGFDSAVAAGGDEDEEEEDGECEVCICFSFCCSLLYQIFSTLYIYRKVNGLQTFFKCFSIGQIASEIKEVAIVV